MLFRSSVLAGWLATWSEHHQLGRRFTVDLKPHTSGSELLALTVRDDAGEKAAELVFATIQDRRGRNILSVRDQSTLDTSLRRKRLMTLIHLYLIHRYQSGSVHYVSPTDDNEKQSEAMKAMGIYESVHHEIGQIIVANVDTVNVAKMMESAETGIDKIIRK